MKKCVVLSFVSFLILAFGSVVDGQEKAPVLEFKASGFIDAQSLWFKNAGSNTTTAGIYNTFAYANNFVGGRPSGALDNGSVAFWESRARLKFDAVMGKELSGTFFFEFDSQPWGNTSAGTRNSYGYWGGDRASLEVKNIYLDFSPGFMPIPTTVRVGEQGFAIRPTLLLSTDGIGIMAAFRPDPVTIQFMYGKPWEGNVWANDDGDMGALQVSAKISTFTVGGYGLYYQLNAYPTDQANLASLNKAELWWFGGYFDGKVGPVTLNLDFIYDHGFVRSRADGLKPIPVRYDGWLGHGKVDFAIEKANIGLLGYYATGADTNQTGTTGLPGANPQNPGHNSRRVGSYIVPVSSESGTGYGESIVFYSTWVNRGDSGISTNVNYTQSCRGPVGGTWMAKVYGSYKIIPEFKMTVQGMYIGDTTKNGNTFGTARGDTGRPKDYSYIGTEADIIGEWNIYKNLKFTAAYGYLWAGRAMQLWSGVRNHPIQNPYQVTTNLTYSF